MNKGNSEKGSGLLGERKGVVMKSKAKTARMRWSLVFVGVMAFAFPALAGDDADDWLHYTFEAVGQEVQIVAFDMAKMPLDDNIGVVGTCSELIQGDEGYVAWFVRPAYWVYFPDTGQAFGGPIPGVGALNEDSEDVRVMSIALDYKIVEVAPNDFRQVPGIAVAYMKAASDGIPPPPVSYPGPVSYIEYFTIEFDGSTPYWVRQFVDRHPNQHYKATVFGIPYQTFEDTGDKGFREVDLVFVPQQSGPDDVLIVYSGDWGIMTKQDYDDQIDLWYPDWPSFHAHRANALFWAYYDNNVGEWTRAWDEEVGAPDLAYTISYVVDYMDENFATPTTNIRRSSVLSLQRGEGASCPPMLAFENPSLDDGVRTLSFAEWDTNSNSWSIIDNLVHSAEHPTLAIDPATGHPWIGYVTSGAGDRHIRVFYGDETGWSTPETVHSANTRLVYPNLAIEAGEMKMSYSVGYEEPILVSEFVSGAWTLLSPDGQVSYDAGLGRSRIELNPGSPNCPWVLTKFSDGLGLAWYGEVVGGCGTRPVPSAEKATTALGWAPVPLLMGFAVVAGWLLFVRRKKSME